MTHLNKIQQFSSILEKLLLGALVVIPLVDAFFWFFMFSSSAIALPFGSAVNVDVMTIECIDEIPVSQLPDGIKPGDSHSFVLSDNEMEACLNSQSIPPLNQWLGYFVNLLPLLVQLFAIWWLRKLFKNYAKGEVFTIENVHCYRMLSFGLLAWFFILPVHELLFSLALMAGQGMMVAESIMFGFGSANFLALLVGFALLIISYVMEAAHSLEQESRMTI